MGVRSAPPTRQRPGRVTNPAPAFLRGGPRGERVATKFTVAILPEASRPCQWGAGQKMLTAWRAVRRPFCIGVFNQQIQALVPTSNLALGGP